MPLSPDDPAAPGTKPGAVQPPAAFYRPGSYQPWESAGFLMRRVLSSVLQQADAQLAEHDLTYVQWLPLYKLLLNSDTRSTCLARDLGMDPASVTRALDRIEAKGLLRRERSTTDRRRVELVLTEQGRAVATQVPEVLCDVLNAHLAGFSDAECRQLVSMLQRMLLNGDALRGGAALPASPPMPPTPSPVACPPSPPTAGTDATPQS
ncbi:MarR family winged helix-turn-helix transcriptional regulator [Comamonas sp. UBA7528]|uniref:MarR family winged helix-turn-helix transcriptional regulator n=1 Tax=Comamonas sp. UBA7528 TaxID=1946391 RepID=UPI001B4E56E8|nr:MarR family winged helix-turn-helix transcriptional regulator [Comamonas sp. UBA7528]MBP7352522.1 winged helix-turn-helix transcriptional regulator [Comamonas sp.]